MGLPFQQTTSNVGKLRKPTTQALVNGLNKHYYSLVIDYYKNESDQNMLLNLYKQKWNSGLKNFTSSEIKKENQNNLDEIKRLSKDYKNWIKKENEKTMKEFAVSSVGKVDPKRHLMENVEEL